MSFSFGKNRPIFLFPSNPRADVRSADPILLFAKRTHLSSFVFPTRTPILAMRPLALRAVVRRRRSAD
jgi:hypothetical protein